MIGAHAEERAQRYFCSQGFELLAQNQKITGVETDLIFYKNHYVIVEVKSLRCWDEIHFRLSNKQVKRLLFARSQLEAFKNEKVELKFAFVGKDDIVLLCPEDLI